MQGGGRRWPGEKWGECRQHSNFSHEERRERGLRGSSRWMKR